MSIRGRAGGSPATLNPSQVPNLDRTARAPQDRCARRKRANSVLCMPPLPKSSERPDLVARGIRGLAHVDRTPSNRVCRRARDPGVYVVFRPTVTAPLFLEVNPGGRFTGRDPTVAAEKLEAKWVSGARVIYVGKANVANRRLAEFARFGARHAHRPLGRSVHLAACGFLGFPDRLAPGLVGRAGSRL